MVKPFESASDDTPTFFISSVTANMPNSLSKFNSAKIMLQDTSYLYSFENKITTSPTVNKSLYSSTLASTKWYGPYKTDPGFEVYHLFSINLTGDNKYYIQVTISLEKHDLSIIVTYKSFTAHIAKFRSFNNL